MAFSDLALKAASESAVLAVRPNVIKIAQFAKNFSELNGRPGNSIAVPVFSFSEAGEFNEQTNNYCSGTNEIGGVLVNLNKHLVKSISITDVEEAETGIRWASETAGALADTLSRAAVDEVMRVITDGGTYIGPLNTTGKELMIMLASEVAARGCDPARCVVVLNTELFYSVLSELDASVYGGDEAIRYGVVPGLFGFKAVVRYQKEGIAKAMVLPEDSIAIASRYLAPGTEGAYPEAWAATDPDTGLTIGYRRFMDLCTGTNKFAADLLFGVALTTPDKVLTWDINQEV